MITLFAYTILYSLFQIGIFDKTAAKVRLSERKTK